MSLLKPIDLTKTQGIREAIAAVIDGKVGAVEFSEMINLRIVRGDNSAEVTLASGKAEYVIKGLPDPDILSVKCFRDHAIVSLSITNVRVDY